MSSRIIMSCDICGRDATKVTPLYIENGTLHKARRKDACDTCTDKVIRQFGDTATSMKQWPEGWTPTSVGEVA